MANKLNRKYSIRQNKWDNWYGYQGNRKIASFMNSLDKSQQEAAEEWLAERKAEGAAVSILPDIQKRVGLDEISHN